MSSRRPFPLGDPRLPPLIAAVVALLGSLPVARFAYHRLPIARGWEADAIARAIVEGRGFQFPGNARWLWEQWKGDPNQFFPTAWVDPVYTYILAGAHYLFGSYAYHFIYALCFACLGAIYLCAYRLGRRFGGPWMGTLAVALLAIHKLFAIAFFGDITNSAVAAAALTFAVLLAVRYFEEPSTRRLVHMGLMTGFAVLTCPAAQYYVILLTAALAFFHLQDWPKTLIRPIAFFALAALAVAPWTIRNYLTFGELVLVRNGAGQIAWDGTVGLAETFMPGAALSAKPAPWKSDGPQDAVQKMMNKDLRIQIHTYQVEALMTTPPPGYEAMNEAQRDKLYMKRTTDFIKANPGVTFEMAIAKLRVFILNFGPYGAALIALAIVGALTWIRDARTWPITLAVAAYCAPFVLILAYYGRYRAPVEPLIGVLAALGLGVWVSRLVAIFSQRRLAIGHT